jgi:hypothetical protein
LTCGGVNNLLEGEEGVYNYNSLCGKGSISKYSAVKARKRAA